MGGTHAGCACRGKSNGKQVALDVARGLAYLHHHRVLHCDLK